MSDQSPATAIILHSSNSSQEFRETIAAEADDEDIPAERLTLKRNHDSHAGARWPYRAAVLGELRA